MITTIIISRQLIHCRTLWISTMVSFWINSESCTMARTRCKAPRIVCRHWQQQAKKLIILSNSSSASEATIAKLPKLGFEAVDFVDAVTSGEEASRFIKETYQNKKALFFTWKTPKTPSPFSFVEKCGDIALVEDVEEADFLLFHGVDVIRGPGPDGVATETDMGDFFTTGDFTKLDIILKKAAEKKLVALCANPDFISIQPDGSQANMPGKIEARYKELGGSTIAFGKPHKEHFQACVERLGLPKERVVHVGDSLHHDVKGANDAGIDSVFVTSGVHCDEVGGKFGILPSTEKLNALFDEHDEFPTYATSLFKL
mmetsp:Transcript_4961/g.6445  ORF Transcript_4961/g.6445 Transcript_4961/m.6445 type:complete len:315 (-) Transcript_4961:262-1206(-)